MPLTSPRRVEFGAWRNHALANLRAKDKFTQVGSVMISAVVLLGPEEFFARFVGFSSAETFLQKVNPDRSQLFANRRRIPTEAAICCLQAAQKLTSVYKAYTNSADQSIQLLTALQTSLAKDVICAFPRIDRVDHIQRVLEVICTFASWTNPRDLLLGRNTVTGGGQTYKRELAVMAEMYECAPTQREENAQVAGSMLEHA